MERLLVLTLQAIGCEAELRLNGIALARVDAARPRAVLPVHEFTIAGLNRLEMVVWPRPAITPEQPALPAVPRVADGVGAAHARVLLPRIGGVIDESQARTLAQLDWGPAAGTAFEAPLVLTQDVSLPVSFPRWRWLDAPLLEPTPELRSHVCVFVQQLAQQLAAGDPEPFIAAARLRTEEIATAYLRQPHDETQRLREQLLQWQAGGRLKWLPLEAEAFVLRPLAGGRLLECLDAEGLPALRTEPDAHQRSLALPLRVTVVEGKVFVLR